MAANDSESRTPRRKHVRLSSVARKRALDDAERHLVARESYSATVRMLQRAYSVSERTAARLIAETYERWQEESELTRPIRRELQRRSLSRLHEAAFAAGFSDGAHFTRTCQQMFGLPPSEFAPVEAVFIDRS